MANQTESLVLGDGLKWESANDMSRSTVTLLLGTNYPIFAVLGRVTATGKLKYYDPAAVDGSQTAIAVLAKASDATAADTKGVVIDFAALFAFNTLAWGPGVTTAAHRTAALVALNARGIKTKNQA